MSALDSWTRGSHTYDGTTHPTWRKGTGPGVVLVHEIPGITDAVVAFAEEVVAAGHTVVMPQPFGEAGGAVSLRQVATVIPRVCISRELTKLARNETTPVAGGSARSPATCTPSSAVPASAPWACASPAGSRWR